MPQFVERALQLGVDLVHRTELLFGLGSRVVDNVLKVDRGDRQVGPGRRLQRQPMAVGRHAPLGHPLRLALFGGDQPHDLLRKTLADGFGFDVRREAVLVFLLSDILQYVFLVFCHYKRNIMQRYKIPFTFLPSPLQIRFRNGQTAKKRRGTFRASFHAKPSGYLAAPVSSVAVHVLSPAAQLVDRPVMLGESTPAVTERVIA